jgi:MoaD family protein
MPVRIEIPTPLREHTAGESEVEVAGSNIQDALNDLVVKYPSIGPKLFDNGKLRPYINIFVNDEDIRYLDEMRTQVKDGQLVVVLPAVSGG